MMMNCAGDVLNVPFDPAFMPWRKRYSRHQSLVATTTTGGWSALGLGLPMIGKPGRTTTVRSAWNWPRPRETTAVLSSMECDEGSSSDSLWLPPYGPESPIFLDDTSLAAFLTLCEPWTQDCGQDKESPRCSSDLLAVESELTDKEPSSSSVEELPEESRPTEAIQDEEDEKEYPISDIVDHYDSPNGPKRFGGKRHGPTRKQVGPRRYRVRFEGYGKNDDSWRWYEDLVETAPDMVCEYDLRVKKRRSHKSTTRTTKRAKTIE